MAVVVAVVWAVRRRGPTWFTAMLLVSALFWDWYAIRTIVLGALVAAPLLAGALQSLVRDRTGPSRATATPRAERRASPASRSPCSRVAAVVVPHTADRPGDVPTALDPQLDRLPAGTAVFNAYELGGWIAWRHPDLEPVHRRPDHAVLRRSTRSGTTRSGLLDPGWYATVRDARARRSRCSSRTPRSPRG